MKTQPVSLHGFSRSGWIAAVIFLFGLALLPALSRSALDHPPEYDELLHVLAARGVQESGAPLIADGHYPRAELYTRLISVLPPLAADELVNARLPALVSGMTLVALLGAWTTLRSGWLAGFAAAAVLASTPMAIHMSVLVRFYTLHALLVTLAAILVYEILKPGRGPGFRTLVASMTIAVLALALHLQVLTLIATGALLAAAGAVLLYDRRDHYLPFVRRRPLLSGSVVAMGFCLGAVLLVQLGVIDELRGPAPAWSVDRASYYGFYIGALGYHLPFIWPVIPIMIVAGYLAQPRLMLFCLVFVITALTANSIASQKAVRYIFYLVPMICAVWAIGFQALVGGIADTLRRRHALTTGAALAVVLFLAALTLATTQEFKRGLKLLAARQPVDTSIGAAHEPDWLAAKPILSTLVADADRLIVTSGVKGLYTFGRYDYELSATVVEETDTGTEFGEDERTGRQVISAADSFEQVVDMPGNELVVLETRYLDQDFSVPRDVHARIDDLCTPVELPDIFGLSAWTC